MTLFGANGYLTRVAIGHLPAEEAFVIQLWAPNNRIIAAQTREVLQYENGDIEVGAIVAKNGWVDGINAILSANHDDFIYWFQVVQGCMDGGHVRCLKFVMAVDHLYSHEILKDGISSAIRGNHVGVLNYMARSLRDYRDVECMANHMCVCAVITGRKSLLKILLNARVAVPRLNLMVAAAKLGDIRTLKRAKRRYGVTAEICTNVLYKITGMGEIKVARLLMSWGGQIKILGELD